MSNYFLHIISRRKLVSRLMMTMAFVCCSIALKSQTTPSYQVKAAFLYNFSQFVEWPSNAFRNSNAPFVIGVIGNDPFGSYLKELVEDEKVGGRPIIVRNYSDIKDVDCHILFINVPNANEVVRALRNRSILTVSDSDNFAKTGGMVRFFTDNNKIRLQINLAAARASNLSISAKLLRVSEIVER